MKDVTKYPNHTFSWVDVATPDPETGKAFYCNLFGWTSHVTTYDIDATIVRVNQLGGTLLTCPFDAMDAGRMALLLGPTGAFSAMWEPKPPIGTAFVNQPNSFGWNELLTTDKDAAIKFYSALYGWDFVHNEESGYTEIINNGRAAGGLMQITAEIGDFPSNWMVYFMVEDVDETIEKAQELGGGTKMPPFNAPETGRIGMLHDPQGIPFYVIQLKNEPDEPPQG